jgi:hypothetical protein
VETLTFAERGLSFAYCKSKPGTKVTSAADFLSATEYKLSLRSNEREVVKNISVSSPIWISGEVGKIVAAFTNAAVPSRVAAAKKNFVWDINFGGAENTEYFQLKS